MTPGQAVFAVVVLVPILLGWAPYAVIAVKNPTTPNTRRLLAHIAGPVALAALAVLGRSGVKVPAEIGIPALLLLWLFSVIHMCTTLRWRNARPSPPPVSPPGFHQAPTAPGWPPR